MVLAVTCGGLIAGGLPGCRPPDDIAPIEFTVDELRIREYSGGVVTIEAVLEVENPNDFEIMLVETDLELHIDDVAVGRVQWTGAVALREKQATLAPIPAEMPVGEHGEIFTSLIDHDPVAYAAAGTMLLARGVMERRLTLEAAGRLNDSRE